MFTWPGGRLCDQQHIVVQPEPADVLSKTKWFMSDYSYDGPTCFQTLPPHIWDYKDESWVCNIIS